MMGIMSRVFVCLSYEGLGCSAATIWIRTLVAYISVPNMKNWAIWDWCQYFLCSVVIFIIALNLKDLSNIW